MDRAKRKKYKYYASASTDGSEDGDLERGLAEGMDDTPLLGRAVETVDQVNDERVSLLIDIVSAINLPTGDQSYIDPYVIVYLGQEEVHRTKFIKKS